ncbi:MAG: transcription termination/antitermination protein NusA [Candidatus Omnitrophica bacterium]|nr:transcription termination/antitermination protein NusA [Candidatus Omnitrophota bacterium]
MSQELLASLEAIEKEKGINKMVLLEALKQALLSACRKTFPERENLEVVVDESTLRLRFLENGKDVRDPRFGRIAAQTAKQVIIQKIREAERETIFDQYTKRTGDIISGTVHRIEKKAIIVDLGKTEGILPAREQSPADDYRQGDLIRAYVVEVKKTSRGPEIILSRTHAGLVKCLFELEVPEIHEGIVQIKGAAREAGSRTKIAVYSQDEKIDCVGSCVGVRGQRVKNIVRELGSEKIDIVRYSDDFETYLKNAMAPAELAEVKINKKEESVQIFVEDDQLSLAIGKKGQNVRLASKLLGWRLDVRSLSQKIPLSNLEGVGEKTEKILKEAGILTLKDVIKTSVEDLAKIPGIGEKTAEKIVTSAHRAIIGKDQSKERDLNIQEEPVKEQIEEQIEEPESEASEEQGPVDAEDQAEEDTPGNV